MSCSSRSALLSSEPSLKLKPQDTRPQPESTHAPRWGTPALTPPTLCDSCPPLKGQKGLPPQGKTQNHGSEPVCCRKSIKCCGAKMHCQPVSVSPRTLCTERVETPRERRGHHLGPNKPLQGRHQAHTAEVPTYLPGVARPTARHGNVAELELQAQLTLQLKVTARASPGTARRAQLTAQRQDQK